MKSAKAKRSDTVSVLRRQQEMLQMIPHLPRKCTVQELTERLAANGFVVDKRTVQRSLVALSEGGLGVVGDEGNPQGWSRLSGQISGLDVHTALTLKLAYAYVKPLLPASILREMKVLVDAADKSLDGVSNNLLTKWPAKVRVLSSGPERLPREIAPGVHQAVSEALLKNLQLRLRYPKAGETPKDRLISPLGMVVKSGVIYLVVSGEKGDAPYTLVMHRILDAKVDWMPAKSPRDWKSLDAYIDEGNFLFPPGPSKRDCPVTLRFDSVSVRNIEEMPLSTDQTVTKEAKLAPNGEPYFLVQTRVTVSEEFVRWLLQYGAHVEVIKPAALRKQIRDIANKLCSSYKTK